MAERSETAGVLPPDADEFGRLVEAHRRDLVVLCYRFLGSIADAEDAAQETALRAWRGRDTFRGEAGVRTWLHRIATRTCLDAMERRGRRRMPAHVAGAADPAQPPAPPTNEVLWFEPLPDTYVAATSLDPAARYSMRESVSLAFTAALQLLPPRQRAVLLLRDVLCWRAAEAADVLGMTTSAVNSALNRARSTLHAADQAADQPASITDPADAADSRLLAAYLHAWEADDVDGLVTILREEVRLAMPPSPAWYRGRGAVAELLRRWVMPMGPFRMLPVGANLQPAFVLFAAGPDGTQQPIGVHVLTLAGGQVAAIDAFMDPAIAARFVSSS